MDIEDFGSEEMALEDFDQDRSLLSFVDSVLPCANLTAREEELLKVSEYFIKSTRLTAQKLNVSQSTIRVLKHRIIQKARLSLGS